MPSLNPEKRKLGQVVVDFANAKSTDEAAYTFFENIQDVMGFSPSFPEQARKTFPSLRPFESLSEDQAELLHLLLELQVEVGYLSRDAAFDTGLELIKYDYEGRIFLRVFWLDTMNDPTEPEPKCEEFSCFPKELRGELADRFLEFEGLSDPEDVGAFYRSDTPLRKSFDLLIRTEEHVSALKSSLSKKDFEVVLTLLKQYYTVHNCHDVLRRIQEDCKLTIQSILKGSELSEIPSLERLLNRYEDLPKRILTISGNHFEEMPAPDHEEVYTMMTSKERYDIELTPFRKDISYCLIEFLKEPGSQNYLGQCKNEKCQKFFIATRLNNQKFCSKKCRLDSHNRERIESGEHARYKRERKRQGKATASYYG